MVEPQISVVVFAVQERRAHEICFPSIYHSDIGQNVVIRRHPEGISANHHWLETHLYAASLNTEFVLVLEDDVIVNQHILENIRTWRWMKHPEFRAGWLFSPGGAHRDEWYEGGPDWSCTQAVVYRTEHLPVLITRAWKTMQKGIPWDVAISRAACSTGKIRAHAPCLAEHLDFLPSMVGNKPIMAYRTSMGTFSDEWRRPERHEHGLVDEYGRKVA